MKEIFFAGIDPGLVTTGAVAILLKPDRRKWHVDHKAIAGLDVVEVGKFCNDRVPKPKVFIEAYRPRSHFDTDSRMLKGVQDMHAAVPGSSVIQNTGSTKVIRDQLLKLLQVWNFPTTHHRDLQAAARIAVYGALKDEGFNEVLTQFVIDHVEGRPWSRIEWGK